MIATTDTYATTLSQKTGQDAPRLLDRGGMAVPFGLDGGGVCMPCSSLVAIAVIAAYGMTKPMGDTLDPPLRCGDRETSCRSYHDSPHMGTHCRKPLWHHRPQSGKGPTLPLPLP